MAEPLKIINSLDDIPAFASEDEEARYWWTHRFSDAILETFLPRAVDDPDLPLARPVNYYAALTYITKRGNERYQDLLERIEWLEARLAALEDS